MKKSVLRQLIREEIRKVVSENQTTNEILGFSKREKEIKSIKQDFDKAREEIKKFNLNTFLMDKEYSFDAKTILVTRLRSETDGMPTYYKILTDPKYKEFLDGPFNNFSGKFSLADVIGKDGNNTYKGVTISLPGNPEGRYGAQPLNKDLFVKTNLKGIDASEKKLMSKMGGKFLDRT